jgi:iron complex outermembrane recepter protein
MLQRIMIKSTLLVVACCISLVAHARADAPTQINVAPGELAAALESLSKQVAVELVYQPKELKDFKTKGVNGIYTTEAAVRLLLKGTPLELRVDPSGAMLIAPVGTSGSRYLKKNGTEESTEGQSEGSDGTSSAAQEGRKSSSNEFRLAQANQGLAQNTATIGSDTKVQVSEPALTEIIVTAEKRAEDLSQVPVPVSVISADTLINNHQLRLEDYYSSVPGLGFAGASIQPVGAPMLNIRGIASGDGLNPTVGIIVDDVPFGSSTALGWGYVVPDIDPSDLARVEILRGPQGTLYGANSLGGLVKFVTVDPSTDALTGRIQEDVSGVHNGAELGYGLRGSVNVPISNTAAIRASMFARQDPGYIDNVETGEDGVNRANVYGGRISGLWKPLDEFSLKVSALLQRTHTWGAPVADVEPGFKDLQQYDLRDTGGYDKEVQSYNATLTGKVGVAELTSISGYSVNSLSSSSDITGLYGTIVTLPIFHVTGTPFVNDVKNNKYSEELRLSMPIVSQVDWLLGVFYTREDNSPVQKILAANSSGQLVGMFDEDVFPNSYTEYAAFTDFTVHFTDRFDVQLGGRESENRQTEYSPSSYGIIQYTAATTGEPAGPLVSVTPTETITGNAFTYLVTPRFRFNQDLMVYARLASGYQPGGPNPGAVRYDLPSKYDPSTTQNYELGSKGNILDRILSFDVSIYRINWKDIQVGLDNANDAVEYTVNAGRARSQGAEISLNARPVQDTTISTWIDFSDAHLTRAFPTDSTLYAQAGDRLPDSSRFSANLSAQRDFALPNQLKAFIGGTETYIGNRIGNLQSTPERQYYPAYAKLDARLGLNRDPWTVSLFCTNVTDRRGILTGGLDSIIDPHSFLYIQPRTIGLSVITTF